MAGSKEFISAPWGKSLEFHEEKNIKLMSGDMCWPASRERDDDKQTNMGCVNKRRKSNVPIPASWVPSTCIIVHSIGQD